MKLKKSIPNITYKVITPVQDSLYPKEVHSEYRVIAGILRFCFVISPSIRIAFNGLEIKFNHPPMTSVNIDL